ncbi:HRDC domain-containing protein [Cohnella suwonensis]|uniref:HRDC domain-containing protein n=1 Tax=Cohnella suwonensis TaxID=696072 RepID=A0ABW0LSM2_9BACL
MQVVFMNQFERVIGQAEERAHVFIGEMQGLWSAGWRTLEQGASSVDELWYEGMSWEELLASFRHGVACKMKDGFRPLLDGMLEDTPFWERRPALQQLLQCYADGQDAEETASSLRAWRRAKATEEKRSAYLIATNRELQLLAVYKPRTLEELGQLPGFGKAKMERYGQEIVGMLKEKPRERGFPLEAWVPDAVSDETLSYWLFRMKEEKYGKSLSAVKEKRSLLQGIRDGRTLEELEGALNCPRRKLVERIEQLDEEGYDVMTIVDLELTGVSPDEAIQIDSALGQIGDRYLKPLLKEVYGESAADSNETEKRYEKLRMARIRYRRSARVSAG